ncbi:MAG TPA: NAD(P)-binding domain-containing protein, partial [Candidatus Kapabacteria bacterium]|nr:NAD(P)-binding domain-containing protein [Candidatus Kapabacteria bacterium]
MGKTNSIVTTLPLDNHEVTNGATTPQPPSFDKLRTGSISLRSQEGELTIHATALEAKLRNKTAKIGVVGLGYVGLPLAIEFAKKGFATVGIDLDKTKIASLQKGKNYIQDIADEFVSEAVKNGTFRAQGDYANAADLDVIYICVPTPFTTNKDPDITYITSAAEAIAATLRDGQLVILKSTTFPNTTEGTVQPIFEATGKKVGVDFFLAFSPERIDP